MRSKRAAPTEAARRLRRWTDSTSRSSALFARMRGRPLRSLPGASGYQIGCRSAREATVGVRCASNHHNARFELPRLRLGRVHHDSCRRCPIAEVALAIAAHPEVRNVAATSGMFDVFVSANFRSDQDLYEFLTVRLASVGGIQQVESAYALRIVKRLGRLLPKTRPSGTLTLDAVDRAIIGHLRKDGGSSRRVR